MTLRPCSPENKGGERTELCEQNLSEDGPLMKSGIEALIVDFLSILVAVLLSRGNHHWYESQRLNRMVPKTV